MRIPRPLIDFLVYCVLLPVCLFSLSLLLILGVLVSIGWLSVTGLYHFLADLRFFHGHYRQERSTGSR